MMKQIFLQKGVWLVGIVGLLVVVAAVMLTRTQTAQAIQPLPTASLHLGIMGDSITDEYHAEDARGGSYSGQTYNWVELLVKTGRVNAGEWGQWAEPRRTGYAYNWARSGATAASLIESGQHTGLAEQVAAGEIDVVFLGIGHNDFAPYRSDGYQPIYDGTLSDAEVQAKVDSILANIGLAIDTIQAAGDVPIVVAAIADWNYSPAATNDPRFPDGGKRLRVSRAIAAVNTGLDNLAAEKKNVYVIHEEALLMRLFPRLKNGKFMLGDQGIKMLSSGDEPHNGILGDGVHSGTVLSGYLANLYLEAINQGIDPDLKPLSDDEILAAAGLK